MRLSPLDGDPPLDTDRRARVGRSADCDLRIVRDTVSSLHAAIEWQGDGWYLRDLGSRNGTALGGKFITGWTRLEVGAQLEFGPGCRYRVEAAEPPADTSQLAVPSATRGVGEEDRPRCALHLREAGGGVIELTVGSRQVTWDEHETRYTLLFVLASALLDDPDDPWVEDERLRVAIWGRLAAENQAASTLGKLIHDTRQMIRAAGVDGQLIEKKRGRTRLTLLPAEVAVG